MQKRTSENAQKESSRREGDGRLLLGVNRRGESRFWGTSVNLDAARVRVAGAVEGRRLLRSPAAAPEAHVTRGHRLALRSRITRITVGEVRVELVRKRNRTSADDESGDQRN